MAGKTICIGVSDEVAATLGADSDDVRRYSAEDARQDGCLRDIASSDLVVVDATALTDDLVGDLTSVAPAMDRNPFVGIILTRRIRDLDRDKNDNWFWLPSGLSPSRLNWFVRQCRRHLELLDEMLFRQAIVDGQQQALDPTAAAQRDKTSVLALGPYPKDILEQDDSPDVITAMTPDQVSDLAARQSFDCLLLSETAGLDAVELVGTLKRDMRHVTRPVIILSDADDITPDAGIDVFPSTLPASELVAVISILSHRYRIERALLESLKTSDLPDECDTFFEAYLSRCLQVEENICLLRFAVAPDMNDVDPDGWDRAVLNQCLGMVPLLTRTVDFCHTRLENQEVLVAIRKREVSNLEQVSTRLYSILQASLDSLQRNDGGAEYHIEEGYAIAVPGDTPETLMSRAGCASA
ncbi:hypothetical protein [Coralliovum pocilloporae]|uniref:hypothetical protein n=1 Tax=Coralliovum pocilloporae TaxID=3066369 RepID=UPI0033072D3C